MDKITARRTGLSRRKNLNDKDRACEDSVLFHKMAELAETKDVIGCYVSIGYEADTRKILAYLLEKGKTICVPKTEGNTLRFLEIRSLDDLKPAPYHLLEPEEGREILPENIDLMFVPLSSFDKNGNRTGYGKGFYDSVLQKCPYRAGIAYSVQEVDHIEAEGHDVPLDRILTGKDDCFAAE